MATEKSCAGGCLCGEVRYEVRGEPVWSATCYCENCTRSVGAPVVAWAGFEAAGFRLLQGRPVLHESSPGVVRGFCGRCGTALTYQKNPAVLEGAQDDVYVATRTLDDPDAHPPTEHVHYRERAKWFVAGDDLPCHDSLSPGNAHRMLASMAVKGERS